ncbi:Ral GTPase-activating protein subunit alpha-2, partial [Borealophlyctis nickersoniae]
MRIATWEVVGTLENGRLKRVSNITEGATEAEVCKFFQEHDNHVYTVVHEVFLAQAEKIRSHNKPDRPIQFNHKEVGELFKIVGFFRKIFIILPEKIKEGWQRTNIVAVFQTLLATTNHPKARMEGFRLLLTYFNVQTTEPAEAMPLFANAIPLTVYDPFPLPLPVDAAKSSCVGSDETGLIAEFEAGRGVRGACEPWKGEGKAKGVASSTALSPGAKYLPSNKDMIFDKTPLIPAPAPPTSYDSTDLFEELLQNLALLAISTISPSAGQQPFTAVPSDRRTSVAGGKEGKDAEPLDSLEKILDTPSGQSLVFMWEVFKKSYLRILFPGVARKLGIEVENWEGSGSSLVATGKITNSAVLRAVLLGTEENREIVHEIIRQSLLVPYMWSDVTRGAILILSGWIVVPNEDRPAFLRRPSTPRSSQMASTAVPEPGAGTGTPTLSTSTSESSIEWDATHRELDADANVYLRRYIRYLGLVFLERNDGIEHMDAQVCSSFIYGETIKPTERINLFLNHQFHQMVLFKEVLSLYRCISLDHHILIHPTTWQVLMRTLLTICASITGHPNMCAIVHSTHAVGEIADVIFENMFGTWKTMTKLTKILSMHLYTLDPDISTHSSINPKTARTRKHSVFHKNRSTSSAIGPPGSIIGVSAPSSAALDGEHARSESVGTGSFVTVVASSVAANEDEGRVEGLVDRSRLFAKGDSVLRGLRDEDEREGKGGVAVGSISLAVGTSEFTSYSSLPWWTAETSLFVWKNMLCVLGDVNEITIPANHAVAVGCLVNIWDTLEKIRTLQPYEGAPMPSLFEFATWIFKAADMPTEFADGRALAYGCMCCIMCRRHDQPFSPDLYAHFYRILIKGLMSDDIKIVTAILNNCTKLFTLCLPGSHILIPSFIKCIRRQFVDNYQKASQSLPETVRQNAISLLFSLLSVGNHYANQTTAQAIQPIPKQPASRPMGGDGISVDAIAAAGAIAPRPPPPVVPPPKI